MKPPAQTYSMMICDRAVAETSNDVAAADRACKGRGFYEYSSHGPVFNRGEIEAKQRIMDYTKPARGYLTNQRNGVA